MGMIRFLGSGAGYTNQHGLQGGRTLGSICCHHCVLQQALRVGSAPLSPVWECMRLGYRILLRRHLYNDVRDF